MDAHKLLSMCSFHVSMSYIESLIWPTLINLTALIQVLVLKITIFLMSIKIEKSSR